MADSPDPGAALVAANAAASTALRETAKWLVSGVVATAVAVFAGSSLTRLGSLDFAHNPQRFSLAIVGALLGFAGLGFILIRATAVLTVESFSFRQLVETGDKQLITIRGKVESGQAGAMPGDATSFEELLRMADTARRTRDLASRAFMKRFNVFRPKVMAQAGLLHVMAKFRKLVRALWIGSPMAIVGFGLFAWAANPPEEKPSPPKTAWLIINQP